METTRFYPACNTSPITDTAAWWDGTLTVGNAPAGTLVRFIVGTEPLLESTIDDSGRVAFFTNRPAIPLRAVEFLALSVEVDCASAGPFALGTAPPQPPRDAYFVPVTIPDAPTRDGTTFSHAIVVCSGVLFMRALRKRVPTTGE